MLPAQAPLPTDCRFPFHPDSGSQTSILISESLLGVSVAATRQNAGTLRKDGGCLPLGGGRGEVKAPAATVSVMVIAAFWSLSAGRLAQVEAAKTGPGPKVMASRSAVVLVMIGRLHTSLLPRPALGKRQRCAHLPGETRPASPSVIRTNTSAQT